MNPYEILGLPNPCSEDQLKKRFHELAQQHHPDKGGNEEQFKRVAEAYRIIAAQVSPNTRPTDDSHLQPCNPNDLKSIIASFCVSVEDIKNGKQIPVNYFRRYLCTVCKGNQEPHAPKCKSCVGRGFFEKAHHIQMQIHEVK